MKSLHSYRALSLLTLAVILGVNCSSEPPEIIIDTDFQIYVDRFIEEAALRGQTIDFTDTGLKFEFGTVPQGAAGVCSELGGPMDGSHEIRILKSYWDGLIDAQKERLVYHELGHCELARPHDNQIFSNGDWKSIMRGDPLPEGKTALVNYSGSRKEYYIDELFNVGTSSPSWLNRSAGYRDILPEDKELLYAEDNVETWSGRPAIVEGDNFEIEVTMEQVGGLGFTGFMWSGADVASAFHFVFFESNQLWVSSGSTLYGVMHVIDFTTQKSYEKNILTLRKQGDFYYFFLNEQFVYWLDYEPLKSTSVQSLISNDPGVEIEVESVRVYKIP